MRTAFRRHQREDEEESVFVSMTDMTVSFLFIVMILLAFFASQFNPKESVPKAEYDRLAAEHEQSKIEVARLNDEVARFEEEVSRLTQQVERLSVEREQLKTENDQLRREIEQLIAEIERLKSEIERLKAERDPLEEYLTRTADERRRILERLRDQLKIDFPDLQVVISEENDALRFEGDGLFRSGQSTLREDRIAFVQAIASQLEQTLPCYTLGANANWSGDCNSGAAIIEAVQIEGHTDSTGGDIDNLRLSTQRANETFVTMVGHESGLIAHENFRGQPVLSVAGYGEMRPIADNDTSDGLATNRRIDLRIIMYTPSRSDEIDRIRDALRRGLEVEVR